MSEHLVAFDTDRIKDYVFGRGSLKEIRGGSALLDQLNREVMRDMVAMADEDVVYCNGGAGLFVVEKQPAEIIEAVKGAYREATVTASVTGVGVALPHGREEVKKELKRIRYRLRLAKDSGTASVLPLTHPLLHFCDSCGTHYASETLDGEALCRGCTIKRNKDRQLKEEIERLTGPDATPDPDSPRLWERLIGRLQERGYPVRGYGRPEAFNELGDISQPGGYMALIYADGDGMGQHIDQIDTLGQMREFSRAVDQSVYDAVQDAIVKHLAPEGRRVWPFDILLLGGDDLVMVTRAQSAMDAAQHIVQRFPELTEARYGERLDLSASVVLAQVNFPIGALMDLADSGLRFAKREAAQRRKGGEKLGGGLINFLVVSSANHLDFAAYYSETLRQDVREETYYQEAERVYRTQRPYTAEACGKLLNQIRDLRRRNVPRTKLEQLRSAVFKSREQATIDAMMATLRVASDDHREALFSLVGSRTDEKLRLPWIKQEDGRWTTPVLDAVELFDFVR